MFKQLSRSYCCIGLMSGTSLDGLDIAMCKLQIDKDVWSYSFGKTQTVEYCQEWKERLRQAHGMSGYELMKLNREYGFWLGQQVRLFLENGTEEPDFIASHGHTVYHEPNSQFNLQIGDGASIAASAGITTISDFRSLDICRGGQGAPLVPIGDQLLFGQYVACVNLGGFANVSCEIGGKRVAWDICAVNFVLNRLTKIAGYEYDEGGQLGKKGCVVPGMLEELNQLYYYKQLYPKSLGQEWVEKELWPIIMRYGDEPVEDLLRTYYEHVTLQITSDLKLIDSGKVLFTGGGVHNTFLMQLMKDRLHLKVVIPEMSLIDFKEALVFAVLGALRWNGWANCLASVTGASQDSSSGSIYLV